MAGKAKQVIGVERNPAAVKDAAANARRNKIANARFVCADATEWMAAAAGEGLHPDVVFLDPPRAGSTPECIAAVNKMKPRRIVYVRLRPRDPCPRRRRLHPPRLARRQVLPGRSVPADEACGDGMFAGEIT